MSDQNPENTTPPPSPQATPPAYPPAPPAAGSYSQPAGAYPPPAAPAYGAGGYTPYPAPEKTNTLAIISLVASLAGVFIVPIIGQIVGIITGHMGLKQIKERAEKGHGLALAGVIIGYVTLGLTILITVILIIAFVAAASSGVYLDDYSS
jgi:hypothetical protein